ncbi:DUF6602 domain-containing protein [Pedobacter endophyticus]|uniref:DUF6602 domain-containing protein n=1 Tax=Pedobacter endophyticus TaxID=2789740 RepID=A0A7U3Q4W1_9SPHI|nr:DUF6602 domain-containing protein [Pedobacter endophyticus]QPH38641.1 hypothetical protein IZT61_16380 [Pedobacter endophyticus]
MNTNGSPLHAQMPTQGWKQFLAARTRMLAAYDLAKDLENNKLVKTRHGRVAEAEFRKWLSEFLPKRYAVASGYIISPGISSKEHMVHYDVIIYDQLESPVLWVEENPDASLQGKSLAIPVEYVHAVFEVKSSFNSQSAKDAVEQLSKLKPLLARLDPQHSRGELYLPANFFCATVFFELRKEHEKDFAAMDKLVEATMLRGFHGGIILRADTLDKYYSGKIKFRNEDVDTSANTRSSLSFWATSKCLKYKDDAYFSLLLTFWEQHFSEFAFDIISLLKGTYHPNVLSSLYCMGSTALENGSCVETRYEDPEAVNRYQEETAANLKAQGFIGIEPSDI